MISKQFEILKKTRQHVLSIISDVNTEQLNAIPAGFNNNIIWNVAHMIASQQGVCYVRGGLPLVIKEDLFMAYKPDTRPLAFAEAQEVEAIKALLLPTIDKLESDYRNNLFQHNPAWTNRYGIEHANIDDSINFLLFHDGLHTGYITSLKRLVVK